MYINNVSNFQSATVHVNLDAIRHNCNYIKSRSPTSKLLAVVKGNAYGHGLEKVCNAIVSEVDGFGVACIDEAIRIRKLGIDKPILLIKGVTTYEELLLVESWNLDIVVHDFHHLDLLETFPLQKQIGVWLKIDTGMHRLGFQPFSFMKAYKRLLAMKDSINYVVLMTHISNANDITGGQTRNQVKDFLQIIKDLECEKSVANSNTIFIQKGFGLDWMRIGGALYGVSTMPGKTGIELGLRPAMILTSRLIAIQKFEKGKSIGYGRVWKCPEDMLVGIVDVGYADGYPRNVNINTPVLVNDVQCFVVGVVSMNMLFVDLRNYSAAKIGDIVTLWGDAIPIEKIAKCANTFCLELLCHLSQKGSTHYISQYQDYCV